MLGKVRFVKFSKSVWKKITKLKKRKHYMSWILDPPEIQQLIIII
jgi:hypothetical protein